MELYIKFKNLKCIYHFSFARHLTNIAYHYSYNSLDNILISFPVHGSLGGIRQGHRISFRCRNCRKEQHGPDKCKQLDEVKPHGAG